MNLDIRSIVRYITFDNSHLVAKWLIKDDRKAAEALMKELQAQLDA